MSNIQLQKIINLQGLDTIKLAAALFPNHKHPSMALARVLNDEMLLNSNQVEILSDFTNLPAGFLLASGKWEGSGTLENICFLAGEVKADLDSTKSGYKTKITYFHKNKPFTRTVFHPIEIKAEVYLSELTEIIIKNSKNNQY